MKSQIPLISFYKTKCWWTLH